MSDQQTPAQPEPPAELWMLWCPRLKGGYWVVAIDDPGSGENYLVCLSEADALAAAAHQNGNYLDTDCYPVRVK